MSTSSQFQFRDVDLDGLHRMANAIVNQFETPQVIGLTGTLGAGKTTFVQAIARAAGIDDADVTSPTFTLLQTHHGRIRLHHLDAYRVADEDEFLELGVEELFDDVEAWTLIEWADRVRATIPTEAMWVNITSGEQLDRRDIEWDVPDSKAEVFGQYVQSLLG